jgi:hypothetical protein
LHPQAALRPRLAETVVWFTRVGWKRVLILDLEAPRVCSAMAEASTGTPDQAPAPQGTLATFVMCPPNRTPPCVHGVPLTLMARHLMQQRRDRFCRTLSERGEPADVAEPLRRPWTNRAAVTKRPPLASSRTFSIKQYNVLSEGMAAGPGCPKRHAGNPGAKPNYGGFDAVKHPELCLPFSTRRWGVLEEILQGGPDLVTLQEIDHYDSFFAPWMREFGYDGCFKARSNSPCVPLGFFSDGCAIFWKRGVWKPLENGVDAGEYHASNQVYLIQALLHAPSGRTCVVGTTQLAERCTIAFEGLRKRQATQFLAAVQEAQQKHPSAAIVFGADLNAVAYPVRGVAPFCIKRISNWTGGHSTDSTLVSAYPLATSKHDGTYTTWTRRGPIETRHTIDYIWHSKCGLQCVGTLDVAAADQMAPERMPSMRYPSHHVPLMACIAFTDE